jgi:hypothetical protein
LQSLCISRDIVSSGNAALAVLSDSLAWCPGPPVDISRGATRGDVKGNRQPNESGVDLDLKLPDEWPMMGTSNQPDEREIAWQCILLW